MSGRSKKVIDFQVGRKIQRHFLLLSNILWLHKKLAKGVMTSKLGESSPQVTFIVFDTRQFCLWRNTTGIDPNECRGLQLEHHETI